MKKKREWKLHVIAVTSLVVFIVLCLACASAPPMPLSQAEMRLDDPRMPPDLFYSDGTLRWYWLGSQAPELPVDQVSILCVPPHVKNLRIDGKSVSTAGGYRYLYLLPGKHTLTFSYYEERSMSSYNGTYLGTLTINFPDNRKELVMEPGKKYGIYAIAGDVSSANAWIGGGRTASATLIVDEYPERHMRNANWRSFDANTNIRKAEYFKYLEPYDSSIPLNQQAFLQTGTIYIVGFNGEAVSWGYSEDYDVIIGIPAGRHELQLVKDKIHYKMTLDCLPGSRYSLWFSNQNNIIATNITTNTNVASATEATGILSLSDIPSQYNGKYVCFVGTLPKKESLLGYTSLTGGKVSLVQINDGKVDVPMRIVAKKKTQGYYGNHTVSSGLVGIYNTPTVALSKIDEDLIAGISFPSITFTNGNASKSANDGTLEND